MLYFAFYKLEDNIIFLFADIFEELINPVHAADELLNQAMKRKDVLAQTIQFIVQMLNSPEATVEQKDGALHMVGTLAPTLLKVKF